MKMDEKKIILYPSNWLYNGGVVGLLKILNEEDRKKIDYEKGTIKIPQEWFISEINNPIPYATKLLVTHLLLKENLEEWLKKKDKKGRTNEEKYKDYIKKNFPSNPDEGYKYIRAGGKWFFGSNTPYQNLIQREEWLKFQFFELIKRSLEQDNNGQLICVFCKRKNIPSDFLKKEKSLEKRLIIFADPHTDELGASIGKFPNSFWNNKSSILICPFCVYLFIHHRLAFIPTSEGEIFINAPDFKVIWDLNKFAENILKKSKEYEIRKILGSSLLQWAIKRRTLLGAWTMMNIEVIIKKQGMIDYFDLPQDITNILLDYEIASLIEKINEEKIFDLILQGKFSELEKANYFVLKAILKLKNGEDISKNDPIRKYFRDLGLENLKKASNLLPQLYAKIIEKIGR